MLVTSVSQLSLATGNKACAEDKAAALLHSTVVLSEPAVVDQVGGVTS